MTATDIEGTATGVPIAVPAALYEAKGRATLASVPGLRVRILELAPDQFVPWHCHSNITDTFVCLDGPMEVRTRKPAAAHTLGPGSMLSVAPNCAHYVQGTDAGPCRFLIIQGVGEYDYIPVAPCLNLHRPSVVR